MAVEMKTTCDRCGATSDKADLKWNNLYAGESIDLCPNCTKALIVWVDAGADATPSFLKQTDES